MSASTLSAANTYTALGVLFGLAFPLGCIAFLGALGRFHADAGLYQALVQIHAENVLLYVVDSAPIFLGLFARFAGVRQDKIERFNERLEQQIEEKTRNLWSALEDARRAHETVLHMAQHDALTGLANRALLQQRLDQIIMHARACGQQAALVFLDLDGFKDINDSLGHEGGDLLLCEVAARLAHHVRAGDTVARLGGDEFVVLLADLGHGQDFAAVVRRLQMAVAEPVTICHQRVSVTASVGLSLYPDHGETADALMRAADCAMYRVKTTGKNDVQLFSRTVPAATNLAVRLHSALADTSEQH